MVTLLALPALWRTRDPEQIAADLVDVLSSMLRLDFVHLRAGGTTHTRPELTPEIARYVERPGTPGEMRIVTARPTSVAADLALVAGARRHEFPTAAESFLLKSALDQATVAIDQALLLQRERERALELRQALRRSQKFVSLIERSTELICFAGLDRQLLFLNAAGQRLLGLEDPRGTSMSDAFFPGDRSLVELAIREAAEQGSARREASLRHFATGTAIPAVWDLIAIADADTAEPIAFGIVARDLSEQKKFNELRERLIGMLGHDLQSPLAAISIGADVLLRRGLGPAEQSIAQRIHRSASRSVHIVRQMLDFTRARLGGGFTLERQRVDLAELCHDVVDELRIANSARALVFTSTGATDGLWDAARLSEIVSNLVSNAIKYGDEGAPIEIRLDGTAADVALAVTNMGAPISPELMPYIFDPFHSARLGARAQDSLGLGLYIVEQIVLAHGGTIDVRSDADGTTFTVHLPRAR